MENYGKILYEYSDAKHALDMTKSERRRYIKSFTAVWIMICVLLLTVWCIVNCVLDVRLYSSTSAVFYHDLYDDTDTYAFEKDLLKVENFDGKKKTYQVILNDYVLLNTEINAGSVFATVNMDFYDTNGNVINSAVMRISVKFLSNKTTLTLATAGKENASFLEQYFADNGIRLRIIEIL